MWQSNNYNDSFEGGGFDVSGYDSPSGPSAAGPGKNSRGHSSVFPITVRDVLESPDEGIKICGRNVTTAILVGIVKTIEVTSTKIIYNFEDWSASITGIQWLESESSSAKPLVVENTYCRMVGAKKMQEGKVVFLIYNIAPIEDMMEITHHYLEVSYIPLKLERVKQQQIGVHQPSNNVDTSTSRNNDVQNYSHSDLNLNPQQLRVYRVLQQCNNEEGLDSKTIQSMMTAKLTVPEIDRALEYLVSEGHIYATIDDNHFKATDLS